MLMAMILSLASFLLWATVAVATGQTCPSLIWSDEFDGNSLDETDNWSHQLGDGCDAGLCGWGNNELQKYQAANAKVSNGLLTITAEREVSSGGQLEYTSSRINSVGKQSFQYGLFEARIKIPASQGLWPAFWMLGDDFSTVGWPACGELDIMENIGGEPKTVHQTMHFGPPWPNNKYSGEAVSLLGNQNFADDFHVFGIEKFEDQVRMHVDGVVYMTRTREDIAPEAWPFNQPFHFLLNVAIGGLWPGNPDSTTVFPSTMEVDFVRVYDNVFGDLAGPKMVSAGDAGVIYQVLDGLLSYQYTWTVSVGATIMSGQGTSTISVSFGSSTGFGAIIATATSAQCEPTANRSFHMPISISARDFSFLSSLDSVAEDTSFLSSTGSLNESMVNPMPADPINNSPNVFQYQRNGSEQYDVMILSTAAISNPSDYSSGGPSHFKMDVYATAPAGTTVILQLENSARNGLDYPAGRHSRYEAELDGGSGWQRLSFEFMNLPDPTETTVDRIVVLFAPNTFSDDTYYFDKLDSYSASAETSPISQDPTTSPITSFPSSSPSLRSDWPTLLGSAPPSWAPTESPHTTNAPSTSAPSYSPTSKPSDDKPSSGPSVSLVPTSTPSSLSFAPTNSVEFSFVSGGDNTNSNDQATLMFSTGLWYDGSFPNPLPTDRVNNSPTVVGYQRNINDLYDVIFYSTSAVTNPNEYSSGAKYFTLDIFAPAVLGVEGASSVLLQLENSARNGAGYPVGRHSRYEAILDSSSSSSSGWQRVRFNFVDFPDPSEIVADTIVLLFAPGTLTSETYYFDNLNSSMMEEGAGPPTTTFPTMLPTKSPSVAPSIVPTSSPSNMPKSASARDFSLVTGGDSNIPEASLVFSTGVWSATSNPIPNDSVNSSPTAVEYQRNSNHLYDVILYSTTMITNPNDYSSGRNYFTMDVYTPTAPPTGTVVLLQLENSTRAGAGYPVGRHSRYRAIILEQEQDALLLVGWQTLRFDFVDVPDLTETVADKVVLLFAPDTFTSDVFYYDNLDSYST
jgi:beta-glucanase (GH16 family)